jgi:hypothetical protein
VRSIVFRFEYPSFKGESYASPFRRSSDGPSSNVDLDLALESIIVAIASSLLSISGIPAKPIGQLVYLTSSGHSFQIQMGAYDWTTLLLLDFFYVFGLWAYMTFTGRELRSKKYLELGAIGFIIMFLGIGVKVFAQIFITVNSGTLASSGDTATLASMDQIGLVAMFGIAILAVCSTCLFFSVIRFRGQGWPFRSSGSKPIP